MISDDPGESTDLGQVAEFLERKRRELTRGLNSGPIRDGFDVGEGRADFATFANLVGAQQNAKELQVNQIVRALDKVREGSLGLCDNCGHQIPPKRMEVCPYATTHVAYDKRESKVDLPFGCCCVDYGKPEDFEWMPHNRRSLARAGR